MFSKNKAPTLKTLIAADTQVIGDMTFQDGVRIDGQVQGNIRALGDQPSIVVISETAQIKGEVHVGHAIINGVVEGPIMATHMLELQPKAKIIGDVHYKAIEMHQGAIIQGRLIPILPGQVVELVQEAKPALEQEVIPAIANTP